MNRKIHNIKQLSLAEAAEKRSVVVSSVSNQSTEMLELLNHYNIGIGTEIKVIRRFSFDGSVEIKLLKHAPCILSEQVAKNIFVHHD